MENKEYLYVGRYYDIDHNYILKIGTTDDLKRRAYEHNHNYRKAKTHTMPRDEKFEYIWTLPLSKYNTLRFEDRNRQRWIDEHFGDFIRNDRFVFAEKPARAIIKIRKEYEIIL